MRLYTTSNARNSRSVTRADYSRANKTRKFTYHLAVDEPRQLGHRPRRARHTRQVNHVADVVRHVQLGAFDVRLLLRQHCIHADDIAAAVVCSRCVAASTSNKGTAQSKNTQQATKTCVSERCVISGSASNPIRPALRH